MNTISLRDIIKNIPENFCIPEDEKSSFFIKDKQSLIELRKARWIYKELGEFLIYDMSALNSESSRKKVYNTEVYFDNLQKDKYICKQISEIYAKALNLLGIKAITIEHKQGYDVNHVGTIFELSNGMQFYADLTLDLINIKTGMQTKEFGNNAPMNWIVQNNFGHDSKDWNKRFEKNVEIINNDEIDEYIDIPVIKYKIGNMYTEDFFKRLFLEMQNEELIKQYILNLPKDTNIADKKSIILKYKFDFLLNNLELDRLDYLTGRDYIKQAISNVFLEEEKNNFFWFNTHRVTQNEPLEKEYGACFILECGDKNFYYLYKEGKKPKSLNGVAFKSVIQLGNWQLPKLREKDIIALGSDFEK